MRLAVVAGYLASMWMVSDARVAGDAVRVLLK
jgi:hypothetical protein